MKTYTHSLLALAFVFASFSPVFAEEYEYPDLNLPVDDYMFEGNERVVLTPYEQESLNIAKKWQPGKGALKPIQGKDGTIRFLFGAQQPTIVCAVMQITDLELEPGEQVNGVYVGDSVRWMVEPAVSGGNIQHVVIKPSDVNLETSLMLTTDRRTYHVRLKSQRHEYMPRVSFIYPDTVMNRWAAFRKQSNNNQVRQTAPETGDYLGNLDFNYTIEGNGLKPVRVYNDGTKTIIQMPKNMSATEAPSLVVLDDGQEVMVNYRLQDSRYIVDQLFKKAALIVGVGTKQKKTVITREVK